MGLTVGQYAPLGRFTLPRLAGSGTTPFEKLIPPFTGPLGSPPSQYQIDKNTTPVRIKNNDLAITNVSRVCYTTGATAQAIAILRPLNFTYLTAAAAVGATTLSVYDDPGVFSTNYKYPLPTGAVVSAIPDLAITTTSFVALQLQDGTWFLSAVSSGFSSGSIGISTAIPTPTGTAASAGALALTPVYMFDSTSTTAATGDPATGDGCPSTLIAASAVRDTSYSDVIFGIVNALHPGDPLLFYSPNNGNTGALEFITGYYTKL